MPHDAPLIALLSVGLGLAFLLGAAAVRLRLSPLVGYLIAGVVVGPFTPGFVADSQLASELAEIGVILLMFGVGLHFSPRDILSVRAVAVPVTLLQIVLTTAVGVGAALMFGWNIETGVIFGLALSVASTVVALRSLQERRLMQTERGKLAVGWLVVEDLAMVVALVLIPTWAHIRGQVADGGQITAMQLQDAGLAVLLTLGKVAVFALIMLAVGKRVVPWILHHVVHMGSRELFRLAVLAIALGVAYAASAFFDISFALGALFAGLIMAESELSQQAANETLPLRDAFAVIFFVSVGMLFDPRILVQNPWPLAATVGIIIIFRTLASAGLLLLFRQNKETSLTVAASRAQIGEFSFILAGLGLQFNLVPEGARDLILGGAIISILLNPFVFMLTDWLTKKPSPIVVQPPATTPAPMKRVVLVGYGRVGSLIGKALDGASANYSVIENREAVVEDLQKRGVTAVAANAISADAMKAADVADADLMFVTVPDGFEAGRIVELARQVNPKLKVFARAHSDAEVEHLKGFGADLIVSGEREIADAMIQAASTIIPRKTP
ncbi:MAG TPA: YbaL family putative K(+) efflux transporter [Hyphomonadaceae bacterium]|nr:YbaL family putative K(+) efflux transporter [Hyphomonadaceae bacterium]